MNEKYVTLFLLFYYWGNTPLLFSTLYTLVLDCGSLFRHLEDSADKQVIS